MTVAPGTKLGPYEVLSPLGAGGMGEVYRARDARLGRDVAIKVLPEALTRDSDRMARFEREAKVLASLNHPNIGSIFGFESSGSRSFLVLEYIEGQTLAQLLRSGAQPVSEALPICRQVAEALEAAHEKGIIHRDLKPGNVMVRPDGTVKVLDFGLARVMADEASSRDGATITSPARLASPTVPGVIMGTAGYMSPEQARGKVVDKRSDIFSFGCVLYEMLTGVQTFVGETVTDSLAAILHREPDWSLLPSNTPPTIQLLLRRCLAKDRNKRLRDIGDAGVEIDSALHDPTTSRMMFAGAALAAEGPSARRRHAVLWAFALVTLATGAAIGWGLARSMGPSSHLPVYRFAVDLAPGSTLRDAQGDLRSAISLTPDGSTLALAAEVNGISRILLRDFSVQEFRLLPGTEGGSEPVFSTDGRWLSFSAGGQLKKVAIGGGPAITVSDEPGRNGRAWLPDGSFVVATGQGRTISRIDEKSGAATVLANAGITQRTFGGEQPLLGFQTVCAIPGADYVIAGIWDGDTIEDYATVTVSLMDGTVRPILQNAVDARFVEPGYLVFLRGSSVLAVAFDVKQASVIGDPVMVIDGVTCSKWADEGQYAVSLNGTLAYVPGGRTGPGRRLIRVDATGKSEPLMDGVDAIVGGFSLSSNSNNLAVLTLRRKVELWNFDLERRSFALINNVGETWGPVWTPDGRDIVFQQVIPEKFRGVVRVHSEGGGAAEPYSLGSLPNIEPNSFSPDGKLFLYTVENGADDRSSDIGLHRTDQPGSAEIVVGTPADESGARFASDGGHFAYVSNETGRYEVFVRSLSGGKWQVSQAGGVEPRWSKDGKKLFFIDEQGWMLEAEVDLDSDLRISPPTKLFDVNKVATTDLWGVYDVLPNGQFVMAQPAEWEKLPSRIHVVVNWQEEFRKR